MSAKPSPLPLELFGSIGIDGTQLRSYVNRNALLLIETQRAEIDRLTAQSNIIRSETAKLILSFCEGRHADLNQLHGAGWNSAMSFVKSRIQREILNLARTPIAVRGE